MTDKEFAKYLFNCLISIGADCCSKCAYYQTDELCDNLKSEVLNDDICINGMYEYAKANQE